MAAQTTRRLLTARSMAADAQLALSIRGNG